MSGGSCALLGREFPFLVNASNDRQLPSDLFGYPLGGGAPGFTDPENLSPPNVTYGEVTAEWQQICGLPAFANLSAELRGSDFAVETILEQRYASIEFAFAWSAACPERAPTTVAPGPNVTGNLSAPDGANYTANVDWMAPNILGTGCAYREGWSTDYEPNGTSTWSGPWEWAGPQPPLALSTPSCATSCRRPPPEPLLLPVLVLGALGGVAGMLWLTAGRYDRRHPPPG